MFTSIFPHIPAKKLYFEADWNVRYHSL